jgi:hypothetical protein
MEKKKEPCKSHRIAFGSWKSAELEAMALRGKLFTRCPKCKWIILKESSTI